MGKVVDLQQRRRERRARERAIRGQTLGVTPGLTLSTGLPNAAQQSGRYCAACGITYSGMTHICPRKGA